MAPKLFLFAAAVALFAPLAAAIVTTLGAYDEECFYETIEANNKLVGSFEVITGGLLDVDAVVYGPQSEVHYSVQRQKSGSFTLNAQITGVYRLCFSNRMSTMAEKSVAFSLHKGDELFQDIAKQDQITPLEHEVTQLADAITKVEDEQQYMWSREKASREMNESTNSRVLWYSIAETSVLLITGAWQLWTIRSYFDKGRGYAN